MTPLKFCMSNFRFRCSVVLVSPILCDWPFIPRLYDSTCTETKGQRDMVGKKQKNMLKHGRVTNPRIYLCKKIFRSIKSKSVCSYIHTLWIPTCLFKPADHKLFHADLFVKDSGQIQVRSAQSMWLYSYCQALHLVIPQSFTDSQY